MVQILEFTETGGIQQFGEKRPPLDHDCVLSVSDPVQFLLSPFVHPSEWELVPKYAPMRALVTCSDSQADAFEHLRKLEPYIEEMLDQLAFLWNESVSVYRVEAVDVSSPVSVDELRTAVRFEGYSAPKLRQSVFHIDASLTGALVPFGKIKPNTQAALRWYNVGLAAQADIQRFIAFWIGLELLVRDLQDQVVIPYKAPCGHTIPQCPVCDQPTNKAIGGEQSVNYLVERMGLERAQAKRMWHVRQIVHGNNKLTPDELTRMASDVGLLWVTLRRALASEIGFSAPQILDAPLATASLFMEIERSIAADDLSPPARTFPPNTYPLMRLNIL